jgi:hypothetical protein
MDHNIEAIAKEMSEFAASIVDVRVEAFSENPNEMRIFLAWLSSDISRDAAISLCRDWALLIRRSLPEKGDDYSSGISVISPLGRTLGAYCVGWAGHEDAWFEDNGSDAADPREWETLYQRLDDYLAACGNSDSQGNGDYFLFDEESGHRDQSLTIYRIEFLTRDLVSGIQAILSDGYADWSVYVVLDLIPPINDIGSEGIQIFADRIVEKWNRDLLVKRLGDRLKT